MPHIGQASAAASAPHQLPSKTNDLCNGQIDVAHFQPTEVGFVMLAEAFRPAAAEVRHVFDHNKNQRF
jgi:hypothetical protein